jgi:hypothetical protein
MLAQPPGLMKVNQCVFTIFRRRQRIINKRCALFLLASFLWMPLVFIPAAQAQQTLGGITGTVTDSSGAVLPDTTVTIVGDQTTLTRTQKTNESRSYDFVNLPIGTYTLTFIHD